MQDPGVGRDRVFLTQEEFRQARSAPLFHKCPECMARLTNPDGDSLILSDPRMVRTRGPHANGQYCIRMDIYLNGEKTCGFLESEGFHHRGQYGEYLKRGPWFGMYPGPDGYRVPGIGCDPYQVAAEVLEYRQERLDEASISLANPNMDYVE